MTQSPLTIVNVGDFPTGLRSNTQYSIQIKLSNGFTRLGHLVLNFADRDMARAQSWLKSRKLGRRAVNATLIEFCRHHRPDLMFLGHADMINPQTLDIIRESLPNLRVAQWNADPLFEPDNVRRIRNKLAQVDATFITTAGEPLAQMREGGRYVMSFMPNPVDRSIERGRADLVRDLPYDLFYACGNPREPLRTICGTAWDMDRFIGLLAEHLPQLRMKLAGLRGMPHMNSTNYMHSVASSAIGLNISRRADHFLYSSDRIAQLAGNGTLVAIERQTGYETYFEEDEMLFFATQEELEEKLARLTAEPETRMRMAEAGRARYFARFNEQAVAAHLVAVLLGERAPEDMPW